MYLERRRQAVPAEEIMRGLEQGSFDFDAQGWAKEDRLRLLALSLSKNTAISAASERLGWIEGLVSGCYRTEEG